MIGLAAFLSYLLWIETLKPRYRHGRIGADGYCDCIGLGIGALERAGLHWRGVHGSNWAARNAVEGLERIGDGNLEVGDWVFKADPTGKNLPDRYDGDPDQNDYYHVGYVLSVEPLDIIHCTKSRGVDGVTHDHRIGRWAYRGWSKYIPAEQRGFVPAVASGSADEDLPAQSADAITGGELTAAEGAEWLPATVTAERGSTVKIRAKPSSRCRLYWLVPVGAELLTLNDRPDGWTPVRYKDKKGYMMSKFLERG